MGNYRRASVRYASEAEGHRHEAFADECKNPLRRIDDRFFLTANPTLKYSAFSLPPLSPQQKTRYPTAANVVRPDLLVSFCPMTSYQIAWHFCRTTSACLAPLFPVRVVRALYVATSSSPTRSLVLPLLKVTRFSLRFCGGRVFVSSFSYVRFVFLSHYFWHVGNGDSCQKQLNRVSMLRNTESQ